MGIRLNKFIADCTGISRRKADELIQSGNVRLNRKVATVGQVVDPEKDQITLDGEPLRIQRKHYVLFHKPAGYMTTRFDPEGRKTIYDILPEKYHNLDPAGRLDKDSSGVLILSNDGDFIQMLTHPRFEHEKLYRVIVNKILTPEILKQLEKGILLQPENVLAVCQVKEVRDMKTIVLALKTGMNRQIRRSFEALGYEVLGLKRTACAGIVLGHLAPGKSRELKPSELKRFKTPRPRQRQKR